METDWEVARIIQRTGLCSEPGKTIVGDALALPSTVRPYICHLA